MRIAWTLWKRFLSAGSGRPASTVSPVGVALAACLSVLVGCQGEPTPTRLELADLARFSEQYDGERVSTAGNVRTHPDPEHYWLEDEDLNRVAVHPDSAVNSLVGERVRIVGRFRFSREKGRSIDAEEVAVEADKSLQ